MYNLNIYNLFHLSPFIECLVYFQIISYKQCYDGHPNKSLIICMYYSDFKSIIDH